MTDASASARAYRVIREDVIRGVRAAGEMLSESELAAALGVSRTPIRSALARLQDEGWLTIYPKRGALVSALTDADQTQILEARIALESSSIASVSSEARQALSSALRALVDRQRVALAARDIEGFVEHTLRFHGSFVEVGGNRWLVETATRLLDRQRQMLFTQQDRMFSRADDIIAEHTALLDHLADDDVAAFTAALRAHMLDTHGQ